MKLMGITEREKMKEMKDYLRYKKFIQNYDQVFYQTPLKKIFLIFIHSNIVNCKQSLMLSENTQKFTIKSRADKHQRRRT